VAALTNALLLPGVDASGGGDILPARPPVTVTPPTSTPKTTNIRLSDNLHSMIVGYTANTLTMALLLPVGGDTVGGGDILPARPSPRVTAAPGWRGLMNRLALEEAAGDSLAVLQYHDSSSNRK
jgi:hypothetical protein